MTKTELTDYEKAILLFYLKGTLSDLSKALIFFFIFYILGLHKELLYGIVFLILFRVFSGGIHCKTYLRCLLLSFVILSTGTILGKYLILPKYLMIILSVSCGIIICLLSPVLAPTRPALTKEAVNSAKLKEGVIVGAFTLVLLLIETNVTINIGFWFLVLHAIQLSIAYIRR